MTPQLTMSRFCFTVTPRIYVIRIEVQNGILRKKNLPLYFTDPVSMPRSIGTKPEMLINSVEL